VTPPAKSAWRVSQRYPSVPIKVGIPPRLRTVLADSGDVSEEEFARADADGLLLLAPLVKDLGPHRGHTPRSSAT
jgi:hypothetical protein